MTACFNEIKGLSRISAPTGYTEETYTAGPEPIDLPKIVMFFNSYPIVYFMYFSMFIASFSIY